jgi:hypothetical protein
LAVTEYGFPALAAAFAIWLFKEEIEATTLRMSEISGAKPNCHIR